MVQLGEHCSMTERRAEEACRDVMAWLKCEFLLDRVGETFPGVISGVTNFGLFVELEGLFVEGLVHVASLDRDYFDLDPVAHALIGERSGRVYALGDGVTVRVTRVDLDNRKVDLELIDQSSPRQAGYTAKKRISDAKGDREKKGKKAKSRKPGDDRKNSQKKSKAKGSKKKTRPGKNKWKK